MDSFATPLLVSINTLRPSGAWIVAVPPQGYLRGFGLWLGDEDRTDCAGSADVSALLPCGPFATSPPGGAATRFEHLTRHGPRSILTLRGELRFRRCIGATVVSRAILKFGTCARIVELTSDGATWAAFSRPVARHAYQSVRRVAQRNNLTECIGPQGVITFC
jgi:hypothetical protein